MVSPFFLGPTGSPAHSKSLYSVKVSLRFGLIIVHFVHPHSVAVTGRLIVKWGTLAFVVPGATPSGTLPTVAAAPRTLIYHVHYTLFSLDSLGGA